MGEIKQAAVIGAGVMGAGIAAHIANAGVPVLLLDIVPEGAENRNVIAEGAIEKMKKAQPAPLMHKRNARLITPGNIEDHLPKLAEADWIVEAVIERLDIKQDLFRKIDAVRKPGAVVSSNTSTIPLAKLVAGLPESFAADFLITHFFNPPRYMRLLEIVAGPATRPEAVARISDFCDRRLGKGVVRCKDTPGFIANRIGTYWLHASVVGAFAEGISVEEADAVVGRPMGIPKTGVFGLMDLVGIDLMPHVMASMNANLPEDDPLRSLGPIPDLITKMIAEGYTGRKGKGGFYRLNREGGKKVKEAIDLKTGEYAPAQKPRLESVAAAKTGGLRALVTHPDKGGRYAWRVLKGTLAYAASLVPEIADTVADVDMAMRLGYNWKYGPFELIDQLGADWFPDRLVAEGMSVPPLLEKARAGGFYQVRDGVRHYLGTDGAYHPIERPEGVLLLSDIKLKSEPVAKNGSASLWDIGDGVLCLEVHTKMNALDEGVLRMIETALQTIPDNYKGLVIHNEGTNFSVGANLGLVLFAANIAAWDNIETMVAAGQKAYQALKYAPFPVVSAPSGMALGGGCEMLLHSDAIQAHGETYAGLVEVGVGVVPAWGGCKEMLFRWAANPRGPKGPMPPVSRAFEIIAMAQVGKSAEECRDLGILRPGDGITMNRDRLLADAKAKLLAMAENYTPPEPQEISLPGPSAKAGMMLVVDGLRKAGKATPHDVVVAEALAEVLSGGDTDITETVTEDHILALERKAFMALLHTEGTLARMEHMLETGKPLRN